MEAHAFELLTSKQYLEDETRREGSSRVCRRDDPCDVRGHAAA